MLVRQGVFSRCRRRNWFRDWSGVGELLDGRIIQQINQMSHKGSHPLIRNTYNFETNHQKQAREAHRPHAPNHTPTHHKFTHSIQQLQSKIEGVENMFKTRLPPGDPAPLGDQGTQGLRNKNVERVLEGSKGKGLLASSFSGDLRVPEGAKGQDFSPIRKSYRLPEPKKYSEQSPIKIPPINLHAITGNAPSSPPVPHPSIASTTTSASPPRKFSKKYDQSRSFMELPSQADCSFTLKLNGSFSTLLGEEEREREAPKGNEISLFGSSPLEKGMKTSKTFSYLNIKQTMSQLKSRSNSRKNGPTIVQGFEVGRVLGKGKFGEVHLGRHVGTGFLVALKRVEKRRLRELGMVAQFAEEVKLHSSLDHPTIVKFYGLLEEAESFYLVLEYVNGGTLFDHQNEVGALATREAVELLKDVIDALTYLHDKSIAHRDIKPENIVICNGVAKLCDFGWSALVQNVRSTFCGTLDYAPPEIIQRKTYDTTVDLWCIGVLTYELFVGRAPFESANRTEVMANIVNVDTLGIPLMDQLPPAAREFVAALLQKDPTKRPKITQLYDFPLFDSLSPSKRKDRSGPK